MILSFEGMKHATLFGVSFTPEEWRNRSVELSPEEAVARDLCPETGVPLADVSIQEHITRLWPKTRSDEAVKRIDLLNKWETEHAQPAEPADEKPAKGKK